MIATVFVDVDTARSAMPDLGMTQATPVFQPEGPIIVGKVLPTVIPEDEVYFWSPEWQAGESAAQADLAAGRSRRFATADDLIRDLLRGDD